MKREISSILSIPLGSAESLYISSEKQPSEKEKESDKDEDKEEDDDGFPNVNSTLVIFADIESKSRLKVINREVNMVAPATTTYLKWSKTPITFD